MQDINTYPLSLIAVTGDDRTAFLQGQFSNNMETLTATKWDWVALCNPKGRAIATFLTWSNNDTIYLLSHSDIAQQALQHLQRFIFRAKVSLQIVTTNIYAIETSDLTPIQPHAITSNGGSTDLAIGDKTMWRLTSEASKNNSDLLTHQTFKQHCVDFTLPFIGKQLTEQHIPNHIDFTALNGINFQKGCYTGQEVIARIHYLGKLKQALFSIETDTVINNAEDIFAPKERNNQPVGKVLWAYKDATTQRYKALVSMKIDNIKGALTAGNTANILNQIEIERCFSE
jgi:folate-binding protein YgfZ